MGVINFNHIGVLTIMNQSSKCSTTRRLALQILCTFAAAATVSCKAQDQNTGGLKDYSNSAAANQKRAEAALEQCRDVAFAEKRQQTQACQPPSYATSTPLSREIFEGRVSGCVNLAERTLSDALRACENTFAAMTQYSNNGSDSYASPRHPSGYDEFNSPESAAIPPGHQLDREYYGEEYHTQKRDEELRARLDAEEEEEEEYAF